MASSYNLSIQRFDELLDRLDEMDDRIDELADNLQRRPAVRTCLDEMTDLAYEFANNLQRRPEVRTCFDEMFAFIYELTNDLLRVPEVLIRRPLVRNPQRDLGTTPQRVLRINPQRGLGTTFRHNPGINSQRGSRANERRIPRLANVYRGAIQDFLADELHTDHLAALGIVEIIEGTCSDVCEEYRRIRAESRLQYWTAISQNDKKEMINAVLEDIMDKRKDIGNLLNRCVDLWPIAYFLQREWAATI